MNLFSLRLRKSVLWVAYNHIYMWLGGEEIQFEKIKLINCVYNFLLISMVYLECKVTQV